MTETYPILHQALLADGIDPNPWGQPAIAILQDGSYFFASLMQTPSTQFMRTWHLAEDMTVLGTVDVTTDYSCDPEPYAVTLVDGRVFLNAQVGRLYDGGTNTYTLQYSTWIVDCSGAVPALGTPNNWVVMRPPSSTLNIYLEFGMGHGVVYDPASDRLVFAMAHSGTTHLPGTTGDSWSQIVVLYVFKASTGQMVGHYVGDADTPGYAIGLYMDPTDSIKFTVICDYKVLMVWGHYAFPRMTDFTARYTFSISLDGTSIVKDGLVVLPGRKDWPLAGGSPYIDGGGGTIIEMGSDINSDYYAYADISGVELSPTVPNNMTFGNINGDNTSLGNGRHLMSYWEGGVETDTNAYYRGQFGVADQVAGTFTLLDLPYFGIPTNVTAPSVSSGYQMSTVVANQDTGVVVVGALIVHYLPRVGGHAVYQFSTLIWVLQGPAGGKPNLGGQLLADRIRFWGK